MMIIPIIVDQIESVMHIHIHVALHLCVCASECGLTVNYIITELLSLHKIELSLSLSQCVFLLIENFNSAHFELATSNLYRVFPLIHGSQQI
jgi:hypothetical protein